MSRENMDLVRSIVGAWEHGDYGSVEWAHPKIEYVIADGPRPGSWSGVAGMSQAWRDFLSAWEGIQCEADNYRELDDERVLVLHHWSGRGKRSGLQIGQMWANAATLFHIRSRRVTKLVVYFERDRAFADLGLTPPADSRG